MRFGLESANDEILEYLQKDVTVDDIRRGLEIVRREGMNFSLQCIFGSPNESERTIRNTMDFIREMRPLFVSFNVLTPLPGSHLFEELKDKIRPEDVESFDILHTKYPLGKYSADELGKIVRKAYREYYLSPHFAGKMLARMARNPRFALGISKMMLKQSSYLYRSLFKREVVHA
jgi:radical SAM superfamily enzyme YgiQ (UPF0313 family)